MRYGLSRLPSLHGLRSQSRARHPQHACGTQQARADLSFSITSCLSPSPSFSHFCLSSLSCLFNSCRAGCHVVFEGSISPYFSSLSLPLLSLSLVLSHCLARFSLSNSL